MRARRPPALLLGRKVSRLPFIDPCSTTGASLRFGFGRGSSLGAPALVRSEVVSVATATTPPGGALPDAHGESHRPLTRALLAIRQAPKPPFRGRRHLPLAWVDSFCQPLPSSFFQYYTLYQPTVLSTYSVLAGGQETRGQGALSLRFVTSMSYNLRSSYRGGVG